MTDIWDGVYRKPTFWQYFGNRLAQLAEINPGSRILDVGTGGGAVLIPATRQKAPR